MVGFLVADGYLVGKKTARVVGVKVQKKDLEILQAFAKIVLESGDLNEFINGFANYYCLDLRGQDVYDQILSLGFSERKTWSIKITDQMHGFGLFEEAFVLGLMDGDGCVVKRTVKKKVGSTIIYKVNYYFSFVGNKFVCDYVENFLLKRGLSFKRSEFLLKSGNIMSRVDIKRVKDVSDLAYMLYSSCPIHLSRKYNRIISHLSRKLSPETSDKECRRYLSDLQETHKLS